MKVCPKCGCKEFITSGVEFHDWVVDGEGNFVEDMGCYEAQPGETDWHCRDCDAEFAGSHELKEV